MIYYEGKVGKKEERRENEKSSAPSGNQTLDLNITRWVFYRCATTAAHSSEPTTSCLQSFARPLYFNSYKKIIFFIVFTFLSFFPIRAKKLFTSSSPIFSSGGKKLNFLVCWGSLSIKRVTLVRVQDGAGYQYQYQFWYQYRYLIWYTYQTFWDSINVS